MKCPTHCLYAILSNDIFKFGKTTQQYSKRVRNYNPNDRLLGIVFIEPDLLETAERALLAEAKNRFKKATSGNEWFRGGARDVDAILDLMHDIGKTFKPMYDRAPVVADLHHATDDSETNDTKDDTESDVAESVDLPCATPTVTPLHFDAPMMVASFVDTNMARWNEATVRFDKMYGDFVDWCVLNNAQFVPTSDMLKSYMRDSLQVECKPCFIPDQGLYPAFVFPTLLPPEPPLTEDAPEPATTEDAPMPPAAQDAPELSPPIPKQLDPEFEFLTRHIALPAYTKREQTVAMCATPMRDMFGTWLLKNKQMQYDGTVNEFGSKMSTLTRDGPAKVDGIGKKKLERAIQYIFDIDVLCASMLKNNWITSADLKRNTPEGVK